MSDETNSVENATKEKLDSTPDIDKKADKPKKKGKARIIILVIVIVFVLMAGGGGVVYATQHSNPQFCNAICHTPMDPYVVSYLEGTSINPLQTDLKNPLFVSVHADNDVLCLDCHTDGLDIQISEGISWITGNVPQPLNPLMFTFGDRALVKHERNGVETCLVEGCHTDINNLDDLIAFTAKDFVRNPHDKVAYDTQGHAQELQCSLCHQSHEQSVMFCTQCHLSLFPVPDGWLSYLENQSQIKELGDRAQVSR